MMGNERWKKDTASGVMRSELGLVLKDIVNNSFHGGAFRTQREKSQGVHCIIQMGKRNNRESERDVLKILPALPVAIRDGDELTKMND